MTKYRAVVCAIAKDEDFYLREWITHHLEIGFDHIFIYDNYSSVPIADRVAEIAGGENVTCIRWPTRPNSAPQLDAYEHFLAEHRDVAEWVAVIDIDELINLKVDDGIGDFLDRFPDAAGILLNWRIYGSSGLQEYDDRPMAERFQMASELGFEPNQLCKAIHRLSMTTVIDIHNGRYVDGASIRTPNGQAIPNAPSIAVDATNYEIAQLNHYFVKSYEEWLAKLQRGRSDGGSPRAIEMFHEYDRNEVHEPSILRPRRRETAIVPDGSSGSVRIRDRLSAFIRSLT